MLDLVSVLKNNPSEAQLEEAAARLLRAQRHYEKMVVVLTPFLACFDDEANIVNSEMLHISLVRSRNLLADLEKEIE